MKIICNRIDTNLIIIGGRKFYIKLLGNILLQVVLYPIGNQVHMHLIKIDINNINTIFK